ncbi:MAG TPA: DUF1761 domain-containing protein [Rhizobiaceae bacterium]|nr:DUF1761 domain-containing protein [Rhizobiaceae bacterium]
MTFAGVNYLAILVAAIAAFAFGAAYYNVLSKPWIKATGVDMTKPGKPLAPMLVNSFVCLLIMAFVLAYLIGYFGPGNVTFSTGIVSAFFVWLGFIATTTAVNQRYEGFGWDLTLIDVAHWLGVMLIMGAIIGLWGV